MRRRTRISPISNGSPTGIGLTCRLIGTGTGYGSKPTAIGPTCSGSATLTFSGGSGSASFSIQ